MAELVETLKYVPFSNSCDFREAVFVFCGKQLDCFWSAMYDFYYTFSKLIMEEGGSMRFKIQAVSVLTTSLAA